MEYMGIIGFIFGIFGLLAYFEVPKLKSRVTDLERELTKMQGTSFHEDRAALQEAAKNYIGQPVKLELDEDHGDVDIMMYGNTKHGTNEILDVDGEWLLVRVVTPKGTKEKLIRMESVARIGVVGE